MMSQFDLFGAIDPPSLPEASLARPSASPASSLATAMSGGSGRRCIESFARWSPDGYWSRTSWGYYQLTLDGSWAQLSESWPRSGIVYGTTAFRLPPLVPRISGTESGSSASIPTPTSTDHKGRGAGSFERHAGVDNYVKRFPTPLSSDAVGGPRQQDGRRGANLKDMTGPNPTIFLPTPSASIYGSSQNGINGVGGEFERPSAGRPSLETMARKALWPTPTAGDAKSSGSRNLPGSKAHAGVSLTDAVKFGNSTTSRRFPTPTTQDASNNGGESQYERNSLSLNAEIGGPLAPEFVEWLMGYPIGWTDCEDSATR